MRKVGEGGKEDEEVRRWRREDQEKETSRKEGKERSGEKREVKMRGGGKGRHGKQGRWGVQTSEMEGNQK